MTDDITCSDLEELLGDLLAGEVAAAILVVVERHLCTCGHCGRQYELYRATVYLARRLPATPEPIPAAAAERLRRVVEGAA